MSTGARRTRVAGMAGLAALSLVAAAGCSSDGGGGADGDVTIEFAQWWEPELPDGAFAEIIAGFEEENPGVNVDLVSAPYASTQEQLFAGSASGTMPDVMGLDAVWVNDFANQGAIADLSALMSEYGYDDSQLASQVQVDGATYMIPVVNFIYPLFTNDDLLAEAGVDAPPTTRQEFLDAAVAISELGGDTTGWALPLSLEQPNGVLNDVMPWVWSSGGSMLADGQPDLTNPEMTAAIEYVQQLWDAGAVAPGSFTMKEQDKVEEFTNGRVGMMISSLAHINLLQETNPDLNFSVSAIPTEEGFSGDSGLTYASWGIGISESTEHPEEAFALIEYLMETETNGDLSTIANGFPGNTEAVPDFVEDDPLMADAFEIYQNTTPVNEFSGLPAAEQLMRSFAEQLQATLNGDQDVTQMLDQTQAAWSDEF
ncbi:sugar ABC transporter substrate-binding protein [Ruania alkalisoli]|uniref:Sugar ABC transporter substrate-binding protein n=1 Tax=Ruania alkalisoli TaxID=2779775 RepID=A0A7M1SRW9_9MICO|nr:sugar ABC transporter substrate-binding protein [Ruania alkalisoli]QOR69333.1 sugar ABC transporter substrate-binding protein [Ruania alkalisoli]